MARRTGLVTLIFLLEQLCRFLIRYRASILDATEHHEGLNTLFETLLNVCTEIVDVLTIYRQVEQS